jgi:hypothetical protein
MATRLTRRDVLTGSVGLVVLGTPLLAACDKALPISCTSVDSLKTDERATRESLEYVDISPKRDKNCENCRQWIPPGEDGACGSCKVMKGPVHPRGHCRVYAPAG